MTPGRSRRVAGALLAGVGGFFLIVLWAQLLGSALLALGVGVDPGTVPGELRTQVATLAGAATVAGYYLLLTGRGRSFLDVSVPDRRDLGYAAGGLVTILGLAVGAELLMAALGLEGATHAIERRARSGDASFLLVLVPATVVLGGPGEELLYRNVVQKLLAEVAPAGWAIAATSALFAVLHAPVLFGGDTTPRVVVSVALAFVLSLVLGVVYHRTRNLVVPALVHGCYNAVVFGLLYLQYA